MKSFSKWCEENEYELPVIGENTKRTGLTQNYPDAYVRAQYPHKYFNPIKATADLDIAQMPNGNYQGQRAAN